MTDGRVLLPNWESVPPDPAPHMFPNSWLPNSWLLQQGRICELLNRKDVITKLMVLTEHANGPDDECYGFDESFAVYRLRLYNQLLKRRLNAVLSDFVTARIFESQPPCVFVGFLGHCLRVLGARLDRDPILSELRQQGCIPHLVFKGGNTIRLLLLGALSRLSSQSRTYSQNTGEYSCSQKQFPKKNDTKMPELQPMLSKHLGVTTIPSPPPSYAPTDNNAIWPMQTAMGSGKKHDCFLAVRHIRLRSCRHALGAWCRRGRCVFVFVCVCVCWGGGFMLSLFFSIRKGWTL